MNLLVRKLTESSEINTDKSMPLPVIIEQRSVDYWRCPHCKQEIHEKHTYVEEGIDHHSDCNGAIKFPPMDWSKIDPQWRALLEPKA